MDYQSVLSAIESRYGLTRGVRLLGGHQSNHLFHYESPAHSSGLVVKFGNELEIAENVKGYGLIQEIGAGDILPAPLIFDKVGEFNVILMEFLGKTFAESVSASSNPTRLYFDLINGARALYQKTLSPVVGEETHDYFSFLEGLVQETAECLNGVLSNAERRFLSSVRLGNSFTKYCFSVFDFTPDNVFLIDGAIKFIDPKGIVRGIPIIDLAAFAGCARDAYALNGSEQGYNEIQRFSDSELREMLGLTESEARKLWEYGRGIQTLLGARFRRDNPPIARKFLKESFEHFRRSL